MTVATSVSKAGPYAGSGTTGPFTVTFRFLENSHLRVIRTGTDGLNADLALTTDYTVTGAGAATGTVTLVSALAVGEKLTIIRNVPATQEADYVAGDAFPAESHEAALDKLTMLVQQNVEEIGRSLRLPPTAVGASTELPPPAAAKVIGWNSTGDALVNLNAADLATQVVGTNSILDVFSGTGAQTNFTLSADPMLKNNTMVFISGVYQQKATYSLSGTVLMFGVAPPAGTGNIEVFQAQAQTYPVTALSDGVVTTTKLADLAVTLAKIAPAVYGMSGANKLLQLDGSGALPAVSGVNLTGLHAGFRNKIINGKMEIAQRGTSFAAIAGGAYSLDRWAFGNVSSAVATISQETDWPSPVANDLLRSLRVSITTADASIAAGDAMNILQRIEGYNARDLTGRTFTLSFWVRSSKTGTHCVAFRNSAADRSYVAEYTINAANAWEVKTVTVSGGLPTAGTWDFATGVGLSVSWALATGSTFQTTANAWQTGNFFATSSQVNCLDTIGNIFAITGVQLEAGSVATPFEHRPIGTELALCQRYFEAGDYFIVSGIAPSTTVFAVWGWCAFKARKRATPSAINGTVAYANGTSAVSTGYADGFQLTYNTGGTAGQSYCSYTNWTVSSEL